MKDPIVDEVRLIRKKHSEQFNNNIDAIFDNIIEHQKAFSDRLVRFKNTENKINKYTIHKNIQYGVSEDTAKYESKKNKQ